MDPFIKQPSQIPPLHWRLQQSAGTSHSNPGGRHWATQTPPWQLPVQHWLDTLQPLPWGRQPSEQTLPRQDWVQHCAEDVHASPVGRQVSRHSPSGPQAPEQHSNGALHGSPAPLHAGGWQTPPTQLSLQQEALEVQEAPSWRQLDGLHVPAKQLPLQQVSSF